MNDYLGYIIWHSLESDAKFDLGLLETAREQKDLDIVLPSLPTKTNLFKRGCKKAVSKWAGQEGLKHKVYVKHVVEDDKRVERDIIFLSLNKKIGFEFSEEVGKLSFFKETGELSTIVQSDIAIKVIDIIKSELEEGQFIDHLAMRNIVRSFIEEQLHGLWLRSGTYFIESDQMETAKSFVEFNKMVGPSKSDVHMLPLVGEEAQEQMLFEACDAVTYKLFDEFRDFLNTLEKQNKQPSSTQLYNLETKKKQIEKNDLKTSNLFKQSPNYLVDLAKNLQELYLKKLKETYG